MPTVPSRLERLAPCPEDSWRALYAQIGAPWHWHDRDAWDSERIQLHLARADVQIYRLTAELGKAAPAAAGFLELERHPDGSTEIVYLGIDPAYFGHGIGGWLLTEAVRVAFADGANRVWLHTCTLDGPAALPNYLKRGFRIERTETYQATLSS
jgi:ribosomal protein S18 acetylase RimI-like enzyme